METYRAQVIRTGLRFGEGPRWHEGRLWYSDFYRHGVFSMSEDGSDERLEVEVANQPSGLDWRSDGDLLVVSMTDHRLLRRHGDELVEVADLSPYCGFWANDLVVSADDVAYVGNFGFDLDVMLRDVGAAGMLASPPPTTNLVAVGPDGTVLQAVPDLAFPNGMVITPDGATLIVAETMAFRLSAFDIAPDGRLSNRRVFAQLEFVAVDGICLDAEGAVWVANALAPECLRVAEGGEVLARVETSRTAFACMLGGADRKTLCVMTAPTSDRFVVADVLEGQVETARVEVAGAGRP
jgi:sugar lactone lactonase YvrE